MYADKICVYSSLNVAEVHLVKSALTQEGLESFIRAHHLGPLAGEVPFDDARAELYVRPEDARRAEVVIKAALNVVGPDWTCTQCQEKNPVSFELCWQCGHTRTSGEP